MMQQRNRSLEVIKLSQNYEDPQFEVKRNADWISFGKDNLLPDYLEQLYGYSTIHPQLIRAMVDFIVGEGWEDKESEVYLNANGKENLDDVLYKVAWDCWFYGAVALNPIWSNDMTRIAAVNHLDVSKVRKAAPEVGAKKDLDYFWTSKSWKDYRKEWAEPQLHQEFSMEHRRARGQVLYKPMFGRPNAPYALPAYWGGRAYIELQHKIIQYHNNTLDNGAALSTLVMIDGPAASEEEKQAFNANWKKFTSGVGNAGKSGVMWDAEGIEITPFDHGFSDKRFLDLERQTTDRIKIAHGVRGKGYTFGIQSEQGQSFNSNRDQLNEFILNQNLQIRPIQLRLERLFSELLGVEMNIVPFKADESLDDPDGDNALEALSQEEAAAEAQVEVAEETNNETTEE